MFDAKELLQYRVEPGKKVDLRDYPTDWSATKPAKGLSKDEIKSRAQDALEKSRSALSKAQELIYASDTHSVLLVFQAMDAAGKDGTVRHVMSGVNPQGCQVFSFKRPSAEELDHTFLWRYARCLPERGRIGIFNRSYFEEVLVLKVHPELLGRQLPDGKRGKSFWNARYEDINHFEQHLSRNGTLILKFFLHISKEEQRKRFLDRLQDPEKTWKYSAADLAERAFWDKYQEAYQDALSVTSSDFAPWHVIPADTKPVARAMVAEIIVSAVEGLHLKYPMPTGAECDALKSARTQLEREGSAKPDAGPVFSPPQV